MKINVRSYRACQIPYHALARVAGMRTTGEDIDQLIPNLTKKYGVFNPRLRIFAGHVVPNQPYITVGILISNFELNRANIPVLNNVWGDTMSKKGVLRADGALMSELSRMGVCSLLDEVGKIDWLTTYDFSHKAEEVRDLRHSIGEMLESKGISVTGEIDSRLEEILVKVLGSIN